MGASLKSSSQMVISEINVTPLVDVMLVLLIMFMVTAPLLQQGLEVEVPKTKESQVIDPKNEPLRVVLDQKRQIRVGKIKVSREKLLDFLRESLKARPDRAVLLEADQSLDYGFVAKILAEIRQSGASSISLVTTLEL